MTNSTTALAFSDGDIVYLRLDGSSDGSSLDEASIVKDQAPPFGPNGEVILTANVGTADSPQYVWDYSLVLLAQVFVADSSGQATRGGIVYTVDTQTPPTKIEVVQQTSTHLAMELALLQRSALLLRVSQLGPAAFLAHECDQHRRARPRGCAKTAFPSTRINRTRGRPSRRFIRGSTATTG